MFYLTNSKSAGDTSRRFWYGKSYTSFSSFSSPRVAREKSIFFEKISKIKLKISLKVIRLNYKRKCHFWHSPSTHRDFWFKFTFSKIALNYLYAKTCIKKHTSLWALILIPARNLAANWYLLKSVELRYRNSSFDPGNAGKNVILFLSVAKVFE